MWVFAETGPATMRRCDIILQVVLKVGMWITAGSSPGKGE